jgi:tetratricopeptide (TPR) repeat protein
MSAPAELGVTLPERFLVERELGRGGMGTVFLARDRSLERAVAIKVLVPELSRAIGPERFAREIRVTAQLVHPNIVPLFDSGASDGSLYYVMPFIAGETLRHRLEREGKLPVEDVVHVLTDLAEALAYAHGLGIIHRDLKPANVFWYGGRALLADFGIATSTDGPPPEITLTATGTIVGTVAYMSPEQGTGSRGLDGRSDLYSLGCVAYELLAGELPFARATAVATLAAHLADTPVPVRDKRPQVDDSLAALIHQLLEKEPERRPANAAALLEHLRSLREPRSTSATRAVTVAPAPAVAAASADAPAAQQLITTALGLWETAVQGGEGARAKLDMARVYFAKALSLAPNSARALAGLADVHQVMGLRGFADVEDSFAAARDYRLRALAADDSLGEVHTSLGTDFLYWEDDFETAGTELARGAELAPAYPAGRRMYGCWLKIAGRLPEALEQMRAAVKLAPHGAFFHVGLADVLMALGRYDEAVRPLRDALRLAPRYEAALERLEMSCHRAGRHDEALDARRSLLGVRGAADRAALVAEEAERDGWPAARERDLRRDLEGLLAQAEREDPFADVRSSRQLADKIIIVLAELGEWSLAMDWVERAYHHRPGRLRRVLTDLPYDHHGLARDPPYARLLRTAGLEDLLDE